MKIKKISVLYRLILAIVLLTPALLMPASEVEAAEFCSDQYYINETLPNGASWDMCWEHRQREGIIFHHVFYQPKDGIRRMILNFAAVAQIHVPYDDNGARYHDISDYGIGGNNMLNLQQDECASGSLLQFENKNVLCQETYKEQFAYKSGNNSDSGNSLSLFSVSPVGAYYYISRWRFKDDGSIEPAIGATGALQRFGSNQSRGWPLSNNQTGIAHLHNFYWKLDFDLNNTSNDDVVEEINFALVNGKRERSISEFNSEVSRKVNPTTLRHWRVRDKNLDNANGHGMSYDILINESGHQDIGPSSEPFTQNDFYVTKQKNNEKFASHNVSGGENLAEFTNDESLVDGDIVVWPGTTFYHMPRGEDIPHMDAHWSHIKIVPRDWHASNPLVSEPINTPPTITSPTNQTTAQNASVNLTIQANDIDGDSLSFSASGLPTGLQIDTDSGVITGTANAAGNFNVSVNVSDGTESRSSQFSWVVVNNNNPPTVTRPANQSTVQNASVNLAIQANDIDGDSLSFSSTNLPVGLQINSATGVISGAPTVAGVNTVNITVSDASTSDSIQFTWLVTVPAGAFSNQVSNTAITINGSLSDWMGLDYYTNDPDDIDNSNGTNNQIDWLRASIAHSPQYVFINYQNRQNIDSSNNSGSFVPWGWTIYFDTDSNVTTGYQGTGGIGADYIVSGNVIERYTGTGTDWSWEIVENALVSYSGSDLEMRFPRSLIGNPTEMKLVFVGSNAAFNGSGTDLYPDTGSFRYQFTGVSNTNIAPVANNQQVSIGSGASISVVLSANDSNNDSLNYQITQQPQNGSITGSAPNIVYTANDSFVGTDSIRFKANDGQLDSQIAAITIDVSSSQNAAAFSNFVDSAIVIDGNNAEWSGLDRFDADPNDTTGNIDWQDVAFAHNNQTFYLNYKNHGNIDPDNDSGDYLAWGWQVFIDTDKQATTGYQVGTIGADYVLEGNQLQKYTGAGSNWSWNTISAVTTQYSGDVAELSLPRSQFGNPDSIRVVLSGNSSSYGGSGVDIYPDGQNNSAAARQYFDYDFSGGATGGNNRPIASTQNVSLNAGASVAITLSGSDSDNDSLSYNVLASPTNGSLSGTAPNLTYTPNSGFSGQDSFTFNVSDGSTTSETALVNINVTDVQNGVYSNLVNNINIDGNDADWSTLSSFTADSDDISGANNFIDWQRAATAHSANDIYFLYQNFGAVNLSNNNGTFVDWGWQTYIDTDNSAGTGYQIGNIGADYIIEGTQVQTYTGTGSNWSWGNFTSVNLSYSANTVELSFARSAIGSPNEFRVLFIGDNAVSNGDSVDNYPDNLDAFRYQLSGGTVTTANRPVASDMMIDVTQNSNRSFDLLASDQDNDALSYRLIDSPDNGSLGNFNPNGTSINYTANTDFVGDDSFRYVVNDGTFDSSVQTVRLRVAASTTPPSTGNGGSGGGSTSLSVLILLGFIGIFRRRFRFNLYE
ncbi:MAG: Ig-like domain-containing protein [Cocleimonas sp.]